MKKTKYNSKNHIFHLIIDPNKNVIATNLDSIDYNDLDDSSPDLDTVKELIEFLKNLIPNLEEKFGLKEEVIEEEEEFDEINFGEVLEVITTKPQTKQEMLNHFTPKKKVKTEKKTSKTKSKEKVAEESFNFEIDLNAVYNIGDFVDFYKHDKENNKFGWIEGKITSFIKSPIRQYGISYQEGELIKADIVKPERMREKVQINMPNKSVVRVQKIVYENSKKAEIYIPPQPNKDFSLALDNGARSKLSDSINIMTGGLSAMQIGNGQTDRTNSANVPMEQRSRV